MDLPLEQSENFSTTDISLRRKIQGLLLFRLLLAVFFLILTLLVQSRRQEDLLSAHLRPLYFFSLILFAFTIVAALDLKNIRHLKRFAYVQLFFDVEAVTFLIFMSGGVDSLFSFLYTPVIISASVLLFRRGSLLIASVASLSYGLLLDLEYFGWIQPLQIVSTQRYFTDSGTYLHTLLMNIAAFYLVAFLSGYLAEELQKSSQRLQEKQKDLYRLETLHRNIVQSMNSGLLTVNNKGDILYFNHAAQEILKCSPHEIIGRSLAELIPTLDVALRSEDPLVPSERKYVTYQCSSGEKIYLGYTVSSLQEEGGKDLGRIIIFRDLTQLKAMEEHLKRMEKLAFAGRMAAEIAHEIKNPLAAMSGAIQMLQDEMRENPLHLRLMDIVTREIQRINNLVTDFLWLAKGTQKSQQKESVTICSVIQDILDLLTSQNKARSHHHIHTDFEIEPVLLTDPNHFRQILWNLLVNAVEAMPEGGDLRVHVGWAEGEGEESDPRREDSVSKDQEVLKIRIDIEDTGPGISEDIRDKIFDPFFTTKEKGTGLGLSIVYQLVENTGGQIVLNSSPKNGTIFSLFFPFFSDLPLAKVSDGTYSSTR